MTPEELQEIKKFNRNVEWLKNQSLKPGNWITANEYNKKHGTNRDTLRQRRLKGQVEFKRSKTGGFLYRDH